MFVCDRIERLSDHLDELESESIFIMREAFAKFDNLAMLWSIGKDSTAMLWLARKAFFGHVPFPLVHIDTSYKIQSMIDYRDRLVREWNQQLVVGMNKPVLKRDALPERRATRVECCGCEEGRPAGGHQHYSYTGVIVGVRRDEIYRARARFAAQRQHGVERLGSAAGILEPVQDRLRAGHAHPDSPAPALDGIERLGVHPARENPGHSAVL